MLGLALIAQCARSLIATSGVLQLRIRMRIQELGLTWRLMGLSGYRISNSDDSYLFL